jgi:hypothetical protein
MLRVMYEVRGLQRPLSLIKKGSNIGNNVYPKCAGESSLLLWGQFAESVIFVWFGRVSWMVWTVMDPAGSV